MIFEQIINSYENIINEYKVNNKFGGSSVTMDEIGQNIDSLTNKIYKPDIKEITDNGNQILNFDRKIGDIKIIINEIKNRLNKLGLKKINEDLKKIYKRTSEIIKNNNSLYTNYDIEDNNNVEFINDELNDYHFDTTYDDDDQYKNIYDSYRSLVDEFEKNKTDFFNNLK